MPNFGGQNGVLLTIIGSSRVAEACSPQIVVSGADGGAQAVVVRQRRGPTLIVSEHDEIGRVRLIIVTVVAGDRRGANIQQRFGNPHHTRPEAPRANCHQ